MGARTVLLLAMLVASCDNKKAMDSPAQTPSASATTQDAQSAAEAWLALVDAGNYAQSWTDAAGYFKRSIDQPGWEKALNGVRAPLGKLASRTLRSAKYATSLPGAPDGEYVVIQYETSFEKKRSAVETVTPMKDPDGTWRVSGYFIK